MEPLRDGVINPQDFVDLAEESDSEELKDLASMIGKVFAIGQPRVYLIEVNEELTEDAVRYLQAILQNLGLLGAIIPKGMMDVVGVIENERQADDAGDD